MFEFIDGAVVVVSTTLINGTGWVCSDVVELVLLLCSVGTLVDELVLVEILGFKCEEMSFGERVRDTAVRLC